MSTCPETNEQGPHLLGGVLSMLGAAVKQSWLRESLQGWEELFSDVVVERTSLVAQTVKRLSTMWETWVPSLGRKVPWRRKWQPTPVLLPRISHGRRSLVSMGSQRVRHG